MFAPEESPLRLVTGLCIFHNKKAVGTDCRPYRHATNQLSSNLDMLPHIRIAGPSSVALKAMFDQKCLH